MNIEIYIAFVSEVQVSHDTNPLVIILIFSQLKPGGSSYTNLDLVKLNHVYLNVAFIEHPSLNVQPDSIYGKLHLFFDDYM